jgi:hypothetical protein
MGPTVGHPKNQVAAGMGTPRLALLEAWGFATKRGRKDSRGKNHYCR